MNQKMFFKFLGVYFKVDERSILLLVRCQNPELRNSHSTASLEGSGGHVEEQTFQLTSGSIRDTKTGPSSGMVRES